jgi:hypothetical protein
MSNTQEQPAQAGQVERRVSRQDLEKMREIALAATQGQWFWGATPCPVKAKAMALFEENLDATKEPADHFHEIYVEDGRRTAIVGNGPTSAANGEFIATFNPANVLLMLDELEALMTANGD